MSFHFGCGFIIFALRRHFVGLILKCFGVMDFFLVSLGVFEESSAFSGGSLGVLTVVFFGNCRAKPLLAGAENSSGGLSQELQGY